MYMSYVLDFRERGKILKSVHFKGTEIACTHLDLNENQKWRNDFLINNNAYLAIYKGCLNLNHV